MPDWTWTCKIVSLSCLISGFPSRPILPCGFLALGHISVSERFVPCKLLGVVTFPGSRTVGGLGVSTFGWFSDGLCIMLLCDHRTLHVGLTVVIYEIRLVRHNYTRGFKVATNWSGDAPSTISGRLGSAFALARLYASLPMIL